MRRSALGGFLAALLVLAACASGESREGTTATTAPSISTTLPAPTTSTTRSATSVPSTLGPTTTTSPAWAEPGFPEAVPPEQIPWDDVGVGWLLVRYRQASSRGGDPTAGEALFLVDPNDTMYAVAMWPSEEWILDWSPEGRRVLSFRDGALRLTDLSDGTTAVVPNDLYGSSPNKDEDGWARWARFTRPTGRDIVVRLLDWGNRIRLECLHTDGTRCAQLADLDISSYDYTDPRSRALGITQLTWLYTPTGTEVVVATTEGIRVLTNLGAVIRPLDSPGLGCSLSRWWSEESVLAACYDPDWVASPCWTRGQVGPGGGRSLWSVPLDGSPATRLTPVPTCNPDSGSPEHWAEYTDALRVGEVLAAESETCCACGLLLDFINGDTVIPWAGYEGSPPCSPDLVSVWEGRLVVFETTFGWVQDDLTGWFGTIFRVAADGSAAPAITSPQPGQYGGVQQVLTTEETAR